MNDFENELKKRFTELRANDEAKAPTFEAVVGYRPVAESPSGRVAEPHRPRWIASAVFAAAAAILAVVWLTTHSASRNERARQEALLRDSSTRIFRWTMPTDGLLESARQSLQTPALSASVLDAAAVPIPGTPFKGD